MVFKKVPEIVFQMMPLHDRTAILRTALSIQKVTRFSEVHTVGFLLRNWGFLARFGGKVVLKKLQSMVKNRLISLATLRKTSK
jgi:hypothetical protein